MSAKFITGVITAAALITAIAAAPAQARNDDAFRKIVIGAGSIIILNELFKELDRNQSQKKHVVTHPHGGDHGGYGKKKAPIPRSCIRRVGGKKHKTRIATRNCLKHNYRGVKRLPKACITTFWHNGAKHKAFEMRCLRDHGFRVAGRR